MPPRTRSSIPTHFTNYQLDSTSFKSVPSTDSVRPAQSLLPTDSVFSTSTNSSSATDSTQMKPSVSPPISSFLHPTSVASMDKPRSSGSSKPSSMGFGLKSSKHSKPKMSRKLVKSNIELTTIEKGVMADGTEFDLEFRIEEGSGRQLVRGKQGRWFDFNPSAGKEGGEYECFVCDKIYTGKHARSIWRRHLSDKHKIPLSAQPRRTRWDKVDDRRPKTDEERRARSLASKRRWAKRKRAEARSRLPSVKEGTALSSDFDSQASGSDIGYDDYDSDETSRDLAEGNISYDYPTASGSEYPNPYEQNYPRGLGKGKGRGASLDALGDDAESRRSLTSTRTVLTEKNAFGGVQQSYPCPNTHTQPYASNQNWSPDQIEYYPNGDSSNGSGSGFHQNMSYPDSHAPWQQVPQLNYMPQQPSSNFSRESIDQQQQQQPQYAPQQVFIPSSSSQQQQQSSYDSSIHVPDHQQLHQQRVWHNPSPGFATFYPHHPVFQTTYGPSSSHPTNPPHQVTLSTHHHLHHPERQVNMISTTDPYSSYPPPSRMSPTSSSILPAQLYPSSENNFSYHHHHQPSSDEQSSSANAPLLHPHPQHYGSRLTAPAPIIRQSSVPLLAKALEFPVKTGTNGYDLVARPASAAASPERPSYNPRQTAAGSGDFGIRNTGGANPWANPSGESSEDVGWSYKNSWAETGGVEDGAAELLLQLKTGSSPVKFDESAERTDRNGHRMDGVDREQRKDRHRVGGRTREDEAQDDGEEEQGLPWGQVPEKRSSESTESFLPAQNPHRLHNNPFALKRSVSGGSLEPQSPSVSSGRPSVARSRSLSRHPTEPLADDILAPIPSSGKSSHSTPHLSGAYSLSLRPQVGSRVPPVPDSPAAQPRNTQISHRSSRHQDLSSPVGLPQTTISSSRELDRAGPAEPRAPFGVVGTPTPSIRSTSLSRVVVVKPAWLDSKDLDDEDLDGRSSEIRERKQRLGSAGDSDAEGEDDDGSSDRSDEFRYRGYLSSPPQPASNISTPRSHRVNTLKRKLGEQVVKEPVFALPQVPPRRSITATTPLIHSLGGSVTLPTIFPTPYKSSSSSTTLVYTPSLSSTRTPFRPTPSSVKSSVRFGGPSLVDSSSSLRAMSSTSKSAPFGTSSPPSGHQFSSPQSLSLTRSLGLAPATPAGFGTWDVGAGFGTPEEANGGMSGGGGSGIKFNTTPGGAGGSVGGSLFLESGKKRRGSWAVGRSMLATVAAAGGQGEPVFGDVRTSEVKSGEKRERKKKDGEDEEEEDADDEEVAEASRVGKARKKMRVKMNENDSGFFETRVSS